MIMLCADGEKTNQHKTVNKHIQHQYKAIPKLAENKF